MLVLEEVLKAEPLGGSWDAEGCEGPSIQPVGEEVLSKITDKGRTNELKSKWQIPMMLQALLSQFVGSGVIITNAQVKVHAKVPQI